MIYLKSCYEIKPFSAQFIALISILIEFKHEFDCDFIVLPARTTHSPNWTLELYKYNKSPMFTFNGKYLNGFT